MSAQAHRWCSCCEPGQEPVVQSHADGSYSLSWPDGRPSGSQTVPVAVLFVEQWVQTFNEMRAHIEALEAELVAAKAARP